MDPEVSRRRKEGFHYLSQALDCEERPEADPQLTAALYRLGVEELDRALALCRLGGGENDKINKEMEIGRQKAKERMDVLSARDKNGAAAKIPPCTMTPRQQQSNPYSGKRWEDTLRESPSSSPLSRRCQSKKPNTVSAPKGKGSETNSESDRGLESYLSSSIVYAKDTRIGFTQVIGLEKAKQSLRESVILPALRPEIFSGLRSPSQGLLLFGPPGNGKTFLAKALAMETKATLFNITAAVLTSKWVGEGEKTMKKLFEMARKKTPSIIFIDEIDSILSARSSGEHEASRRMKTEFFASFDGLQSQKTDRILVVGATNRPEEIDSAAIRRFAKRIYIPMPEFETRKLLLTKLLSDHGSPLLESEIAQVAKATSGYSASDLSNLARDAAFGPIRDIPSNKLAVIRPEQIRQIELSDFRSALTRVRTSVTPDALKKYEDWNARYGDVS